jgi:2-hydroxychromene-2-carboxylate isomerase
VAKQGPPIFYYDLSSPYAYLAATRVDSVLPIAAEWRPISFGVIVRRLGKVPWSFADDREASFAEIARRAAERGLPAVRYPEGWPVETYSLVALRAAVLASDQAQLRAVTLELFRTAFVEGLHLADVDTVVEAAGRAGLDAATVRAGLHSAEAKEALRAQTDDALARGVTGVPTVAIGERLVWGDDQLERAAALLGG